MAELTVQRITRAGTTPTHNSLSASDTFTNDGSTFLWLKNTDGSTALVSATITRQVDGVTPAAKSVTVPATTGEIVFGPFPVADYSSTVTITCGNTAACTAAVVTIL